MACKMTEKFLRNISIIYLALPNFLFYFYWVNIPTAILGTVTLSYLILKDSLGKDYSLEIVLNAGHLVSIIVFSLFLTLVSGICGLAFQNVDYWAHNVKFYELMSYNWPLRFDEAVISYYFGYYVVPGFVFKMTGEISEIVIFIWTWIGLLLGVCWLYLVLNKKLILVWVVLCIGDFPRLFKALFSLFSVKLYSFEDFGIEIWSNFENLLWVPNQIIPTLLIGGMMGYALKKRQQLDLLVLPVALSFWWAVFPTFISGLLVGGLVVRSWILFPGEQKWSRIVNRSLLPFLVCAPVLIFFLSHKASPLSGFVWTFRDATSNFIVEYVVNIGLNVIIFFSLYFLYKRAKLPGFDSIPAYFVFVLIVTLPLYRMGEVNDLLFRGAMPLLLLIGMYLLYPLSISSGDDFFLMVRKKPVMMALIILLFSSSIICLERVFRAAVHNPIIAGTVLNKHGFEPIPYDRYNNVYEVLQMKWSQKGADQYSGDTNSYYEKYIAPQR
jgi:hypothetical protein